MTVAASSIIDRVRKQIVDPGPQYRWSDEELLAWLSDGQRALVAAIPRASQVIATRALVSGTRQTIPDDGHALLMVYRNTAGRAINLHDRGVLDRQYPDWHTHDVSAVVKLFCLDETDERTFFVYPPNTGSGSVEMSYALTPVEVTALEDLLTVDDIYQTPLVDYVCYRAHLKDSDFASGASAAETYLKAFATFLEANKVQ